MRVGDRRQHQARHPNYDENDPIKGGWILVAGKRVLRWTNLKGGGIDFDAVCLTDDPDYVPAGTKLTQPGADRRPILVQAEAFTKAQGKQMTVERPRVYDRFSYPESAVEAWENSPDKEVHIFPAWGWVNSINRVARIDEASSTIFLEPKCQADLRVGNRFFVSNVREALDALGEFYLDRSTGVLTYLPEEDNFDQKGVVAPAMKQIVSFRGNGADDRTEYIHFRGFAFRDTQYSPAIASLYYPSDGAIAMQDAAHNRIQDCIFEHLGGWAPVGVGATDDNQFVGNTVRHVGQGGVFLCGQSQRGKLFIGDDPETGGFKLPGDREVGSGPMGNLISGNHIHHIGLVYAHVAGFYGGNDTRERRLTQLHPRCAQVRDLVEAQMPRQPH